MQQFKDSLINEYAEYKAVNGSKFNWWSYVNMKSDIQTALGFVKFFYPEIVEIDGCFFLKDRYRKEAYHQWKKEKISDCEVEKMVNLYEVADFFHINVDQNENEEELIYTLGEAVKHFWELSFAERFPSKNIKVDLFEEYGSLFITVYRLSSTNLTA